MSNQHPLLRIILATSLLTLGYVEVRADNQISRLADGGWTDDAVCYANGDVGVHQNIWVDMAVLNLGYDKSVSMIWTDNDWQTTHEADAWFEGVLGSNYERWGVDIAPIGTLSERYYGIFWQRTHDIPSGDFLMFCGQGCQIEVQYALKYVDRTSGAVYWDNNAGKNYSLLIDNTEAFSMLDACSQVD